MRAAFGRAPEKTSTYLNNTLSIFLPPQQPVSSFNFKTFPNFIPMIYIENPINYKKNKDTN